MAGYPYFEALPWLDAFCNAATILSGMGPLAQAQTPGGKVFAGLYALYSDLAVVLITGITLVKLGKASELHGKFVAAVQSQARCPRGV